ncbi:RICIN domain-containing protein [Streptomyces olivoreticuli]|uniref:RICIN domain-containing protein n=1 Tax=Streptomyces olivoreticuli TaxID=68246 RepID=UPI0026587976|nr:RICIN domain-containing protein [Streptomyces olivoreticuli]WKK22105.1 RICIN domain-containing protein [Streptomyces olivoreticuli]
MSLKECQDHMGPDDKMYIKSRFAVCTSLQAVQSWSQNGKPAGISTMTLFVRGTVPKESDRTIHFDYDVTTFAKDGKTGTAGLMYKIEPKFPEVYAPKAKGKMQNGGSLPVTLSWDDLSARRPTAHFEHTARVAPGLGTGSGFADVVSTVYEPVLTSQVPPGWDGKSTSGSPFFMAPRWDSAGYLRNSTGEGKPENRGSAVFSYDPTLLYSTAPDAPEFGVAKHIEKVYNDPNHTVPSSFEGKMIPGRIRSPLHRLLTDNPQYSRNRDVAIQNCKRYYGDGYSEGNTKDCDEYPFASTYEGAAQSEFNPEARRNNFSVLPVIKKQNSDAGTLLKGFYTKNRIIEGTDDGFLVGITGDAVGRGGRWTNVNSGKCLEIDGSSMNNGTRAQQWDCNGQPGAEWESKPTTDGRYVFIVNENSGKCLEVADSRKDDGAPVQQWDCAGIDTQKWELRGSTSNRFIQNVNSGKILIVENSSTSNGAQIQQSDNAGQLSTRWSED